MDNGKRPGCNSNYLINKFEYLNKRIVAIIIRHFPATITLQKIVDRLMIRQKKQYGNEYYQYGFERSPHRRIRERK